MATRREEVETVKVKKAAGAGRKPAASTKAPQVKATPAKKAAPTKKAAAAKKAAPARKASAADTKAGSQGLLRAGLKALGQVRDDVVKRQTNVIESLLGIGQPKTDAPARGFGLESFGIRKFEDVFDQRVATALQRLGMPTAQEIQELREQMRLLLEHLDRIESSGPKR
ncbi:phasin family protein [Variovorax sp. KK3]|uniref:phasin family protein n=1 Tax=Variovorax sp. KK3 TaxID=1855728 RepID=UPI00097BD07E|nr:phasin family protein [Variovorax sp. KK3]